LIHVVGTDCKSAISTYQCLFLGFPQTDVSKYHYENECHTQDLLKLEWEGIKEETKKGNLSKRQKRKLYKRNLKTPQK
jgi:hypothetical protein